jgi:hypothetical protein
MQSHQSERGAERLGDAIAIAYEMSSAIASNRTTASELAARRLGRVLARGANARLVAALRDLARELAPVRLQAARPEGGRAWSPPSLAGAQ